MENITAAPTSPISTPQPDRQFKLLCPTCGAIARMTQRALYLGRGTPTCADGTRFVVTDQRRPYTRSTAVATA